MPKVTIYDIARQAGVSASTVSRVLNGKPGVSEAKREEIKKLLKVYDYKPEDAIREPVAQAYRTIGILLSDIRNSRYTEGVYEAVEHLARHDYANYVLHAGGETIAQVERIRLLAQRRIDGAILIGSSFQSDQVGKSIQRYLPVKPVIMVNGILHLPNVYGILADETSGVCELTRLLISKGRRHLAYVNSKNTPSNTLKLNGYLQGLREEGIEGEPTVCHMEGHVRDADRLFAEFMKQHPDLDGIVFSDDFLAVIGGKVLHALNYKVPEDIMYAGINNSQQTVVSTPSITSLDSQLTQLCVTAADLMMEALDGKRLYRKTIIGTEIIERESTGVTRDRIETVF